MALSSITFEPIVFLYACRHGIVHKIRTNYFKNKYLQVLVKLTQKYHGRFKVLPFDIDSDEISIATIEEVARANPKLIMTDSDLTELENLENFLTNTKNFLNLPYKKYNEEYLDEACRAWLNFEDYQLAHKDSIEWLRTQEVTPENAIQHIKQAKEIIARGGNIFVLDDLGQDLYDASTHKQLPAEKLINIGYDNLNKWFTEDERGGIEPGTTTILLGFTNIGKSIWKNNIGYNAHLNGYNVLFVSVEMSVAKIHKRIGANMFGVKMIDYKKFSDDEEQLNQAIKDFKEKRMSTAIPLGMFRTKRYSSCTPSDIKNLALQIEEKEEKKIDLIVVDYLNELKSDYGFSHSTAYETYQYHKQNVNDLYEMGVACNWGMVTSFQLKPTADGAEDISLSMAGESSGVFHRADNVFGIIQTPHMKIARKYMLKNLKGRDSSYKHYKQEFEIDYDYMRIKEIGGMIPPDTTTF